MLVFWKARLVCLAVPKTGTTALETALLPNADAAILHPPHMKHVRLKAYRYRLAGFFEERDARPMETMAVIREPIDWLGSWYRYRSRPGMEGTAQSTHAMSFDQFVEAWLSPTPPDCAQVGKQSNYVSEENGEVGVDHLFAYEFLGDAVGFLEQRLDVTLRLSRQNVSPDVELSLSPDLEHRLRQEAASEFALWEKVAARA